MIDALIGVYHSYYALNSNECWMNGFFIKTDRCIEPAVRRLLMAPRLDGREFKLEKSARRRRK